MGKSFNRYFATGKAGKIRSRRFYRGVCKKYRIKKCITKSIIFGFLATLIKAIIDTCIDLTVARQPNMLILVAVMEISMILYIIGLDYFLFVKVGKRKIQKEKKGITVLVSVFCSLLAVSYTHLTLPTN